MDDEDAYLACQEEQKLCDNYEELVALALAGEQDDALLNDETLVDVDNTVEDFTDLAGDLQDLFNFGQGDDDDEE